MFGLALRIKQHRNTVAIGLAAALCALVCLIPAVFSTVLARYALLGLPLDQALALPLGGIILSVIVFFFARRMDRLADDEPFEE